MTPQEEFTKMMEYSGLTRWHEAGFRGQGIKVFNCESMSGSHGKATGTILQRCCPEAIFSCGNTYAQTNGDELLFFDVEVDGVRYDFAEYIKTNKIDIVTASLAGSGDRCKGYVEYCENLQNETGVIIFNAGGNEYAGDGETLNYQFPSSVAILVGALSWNDRKPKRMNYSSVGEELDFMAFAGLIGGTSASSPFIAGMTACIFSKYGKISPLETYNYLKSISKDLGEPGDDIYYGEGMPILGDPKTIIKLWPDKDIMTVDDREVKLDQPAILDKTTWRTLVPIRAIAEAFGATVEWNKETQTITIER